PGLVPGLAIATLLAVLPLAPAPAASPEGGTVVTVEMALKTNNGMRAHLETADDETVTLEIKRKTNWVIYEVKGQVTETGLRARFGRLGLIDVAFTPTRVLSSTAPSEGCAGAPRTLREGTFAGTIEFTGERRYVRLEGPQATGEMSVISQWDCPEPVDTRFEGAADPLARERRDATLYAATRRCKCLFAAGVHLGRKNSRSTFYGLREESREGMQITRFLLAKGPTSAFVADFEKGTVTMRPPKPFSGRATLVGRPKARDLWRGTIRIPLLGMKPLKLSGAAVRAVVVDEYHFDTE
ncbi:MAG TPA: hypothetical protein VFR75_01020, partial [Solirubrobacterales bacterium]|nr:hypothetical protein [Solirubrobacterales bacterium]